MNRVDTGRDGDRQGERCKQQDRRTDIEEQSNAQQQKIERSNHHKRVGPEPSRSRRHLSGTAIGNAKARPNRSTTRLLRFRAPIAGRQFQSRELPFASRWPRPRYTRPQVQQPQSVRPHRRECRQRRECRDRRRAEHTRQIADARRPIPCRRSLSSRRSDGWQMRGLPQ